MTQAKFFYITFTSLYTFWTLFHFLIGWITFAQSPFCSNDTYNFILTLSILSTLQFVLSFFFHLFTYLYTFTFNHPDFLDTSFKYLTYSTLFTFILNIVWFIWSSVLFVHFDLDCSGLIYNILLTISVFNGASTIFFLSIFGLCLCEYIKDKWLKNYFSKGKSSRHDTAVQPFNLIVLISIYLFIISNNFSLFIGFIT